LSGVAEAVVISGGVKVADMIVSKLQNDLRLKKRAAF
jgi:hypothetical protein